MADLTRTADSVALVDPDKAVTFSVILNETVARGQPAYQVAASGKFGLADANGSGKQQFRGLFLDPGASGQGVSLIKEGRVEGFDLSGLDYDDPVYLSDTVGELSDSAGTMTVIVGRVVAMSDSSRKKVLYIDADWLRAWS